MSDKKREQHPLLSDDLSEDEYRVPESPTYQRRIFPSNAGRARYHARGAASIIKQWPDHMSSFLTYWWMGLAMIAFTVLIIYNSVLAIAVVPPQSRTHKMSPEIKVDNTFSSAPHKTVYMHVIVNDLNFNFDSYLPYIEIVIRNHPDFQYNFAVFLNDTLDYLDENIKKHDTENNDIAFNSLLKDKQTTLELSKNIKLNIQYKSLSQFMRRSPVKKIWRHLPDEFYGFLIRCISIWNKGGIAINPILFTPKSPHPHYIERISSIFSNFKNKEHDGQQDRKLIKDNKQRKIKVDNIQDIIKAIEYDNSYKNDSENTDFLVEAENKYFESVANKTDTQIPLTNTTFSKKDEVKNEISSKYSRRKVFSNKFHSNYSKRHLNSNAKRNSSLINKNSTSNEDFFPMFLKFLYTPGLNNSAMDDKHLERNADKPKIYENNMKSSQNIEGDTKKIPFLSKLKGHRDKNYVEEDLALNIDLKGNIVATKTSCHAFLGTVFNSVIHHLRDESVTDFIISELTVFCKGTWISCRGVDVILL